MGNAITSIELGRRYGEVWGVRNATFTLKKHELGVLVGPNGAGKTTTVKVLTTLLKPSKGKAEVLSMDVIKEYREIRKRIAYLPQGYRMNPNLTPLEAVKWGLVVRGFSIAEASLQAKKWIELMELWGVRNKVGWALSGGERRRVEMAMALASNAELIFLDEPTVGLDVKARHKIWKIMRKMVKKDTTILFTTHDMKEAETIADTVILLNNGETLVQATPQKLMESLPYQYKLLIRKEALNSRVTNLFSGNLIDLGDRLIIHVKNRKEADDLMSRFNDLACILSVDRIGLEDVYLQYVSKRQN